MKYYPPKHAGVPETWWLKGIGYEVEGLGLFKTLVEAKLAVFKKIALELKEVKDAS